MKGQIPNLLTWSRLVLAGVFFTLLSFYQYEGRGDPTLLNVAFFIYSVALFTDYLDGYLARKWKVEGAFGRIVDPFVDKILVLGSFAFFAGKNFLDISHLGAQMQLSPDGSMLPPAGQFVTYNVTGVAPVVVVLLLGRELLVTSLRGLSESSGQSFGAAMAGKVKMVFQSVTILIILAYVNYIDLLKHWNLELPARILRDIGIWGTVIITLLSSVGYIRKAAAGLKKASS